MISQSFEKKLRNWKLPPPSGSDVFGRSSSSCIFPDRRVRTEHKEIPLQEGSVTFPTFSKFRKRGHQICNGSILNVGMIQVALKPTKLPSNTSAIISLRDNRINYPAYVLGMVESSLCDGPIYFHYFPTYCIPLSDSRDSFRIDVEIQGDESVTLMYRFHYKVAKTVFQADFKSRIHVDERGKTTLYLTNIAQGNRVVSKTITWDQCGTGQRLAVGNELTSSGETGSANVDWKETAKAHVLKVDVPGFRKEEVKVEVEGGRMLQISGERMNEEEEEEEKWHCKERSRGKFLRRLRLPENAKLGEVKAGVENGVLTVTVPKEEVDKKSQVVVIDISG